MAKKICTCECPKGNFLNIKTGRCNKNLLVKTKESTLKRKRSTSAKLRKASLKKKKSNSPKEKKSLLKRKRVGSKSPQRKAVKVM